MLDTTKSTPIGALGGKHLSLSAALAYARGGWKVFPCDWRKQPRVRGGFHAATTDDAQIYNWFARWPNALIGAPTGRASSFVVLDVDVKLNVNGFDALDELGVMLPDTPMVHTPSGGLHVYFDRGNTEIRNSVGKLGPGLDVRGDVGYVIVPSEGSGYWWDPHCSLAVSLVPVPTWLIPTEQRGTMSARPVGPTTGLSPYAEAALNSACRNILGAPAGQQEATLNGECFAIGALAGAGGIPTDFARRVLIWAAERLPSYDAQRPWRSREIEQKVSRAFNDGMRRPRGACRAA